MKGVMRKLESQSDYEKQQVVKSDGMAEGSEKEFENSLEAGDKREENIDSFQALKHVGFKKRNNLFSKEQHGKL